MRWCLKGRQFLNTHDNQSVNVSIFLTKRFAQQLSGDTVQSLAKRMAYTDYPVERFLTINALGRDATLRPGARVKIVTD